MNKNIEVEERMAELIDSARAIISAMEKHIEDLYSAEGFYKVFAAGFLPVPHLWNEVEEFKYAKAWSTRPVKGSVKVVDENGRIVKADKIVSFALKNLNEVEYNLKNLKLYFDLEEKR